MAERINWNEVLGWKKDQFDDLRNAGFAYIRQGKYDIAVPFFEALALLNPENSYDVQTLGALYLEVGDFELARIQLNKALQLDADHTPTLLNLAKTFFLVGKTSEGIKLAQILKDDPNRKVANIAAALLLAYS